MIRKKTNCMDIFEKSGVRSIGSALHGVYCIGILLAHTPTNANTYLRLALVVSSHVNSSDT